MFAKVVNADDRGVVETGDGFGLAAEAQQFLRRGAFAPADNLQGDEAVELLLPGEEDDTHAARVDLLQEVVAGNVGRGTRAIQGRRHHEDGRVLCLGNAGACAGMFQDPGSRRG